eukprot:scaffold36454_cov68-Phaeocystis_antarctica.AAC.6
MGYCERGYFRACGEDVRGAAARDGGGHVEVLLVVDHHLLTEGAQHLGDELPVALAQLRRAHPHGDALLDRGGSVGHRAHRARHAEVGGERPKRRAGEDAQHDRRLVDAASELLAHGLDVLRLAREQKQVSATHGLAGAAVDHRAEPRPEQLGAALVQVKGVHLELWERRLQAIGQSLCHLATADHGYPHGARRGVKAPAQRCEGQRESAQHHQTSAGRRSEGVRRACRIIGSKRSSKRSSEVRG